MRQRLLPLVLILVLVSPPWPDAARAGAETPPDYDLPAEGGAHFFTQANGRGGVDGTGYAVSNADGVHFWDFFNAVGGVQAVGYPISHRFIWNGFVVQAFQKVVFQWRPEANAVYYVNILDEIHAAGLDGYLEAARQIPPPADWSGDTARPFAQVLTRHLALLAPNAAIALAYYAEADPINRNGLPMAPVRDMGGVLVLRTQRKVFQQWLVDVPWARAGEVIVANGGDLGKEAGLYPYRAIIPLPPSEAPLPAVDGATAAARPVWTPVGPAGADIRALAVDPRRPDTLYAAGAGLFRTEDAGASWGIAVTLPRDLHVDDVAVSPADPAVLYIGSVAGCRGGPATTSYRTVNGGDAWAAIGVNLGAFAPHPRQAEIVYAASCAGPVRSRDGGVTWQLLEGVARPDQSVLRIKVAPRAPDTVYVLLGDATGAARVARSEDGGETWRDVGPAAPIGAAVDLELDPGDPDTLYALTSRGVFRSADGGTTWRAANEGLDGARAAEGPDIDSPFAALTVDPERPQVLYLATGGLRPRGAGIYRSWDSGGHWDSLSNGIGRHPVRDILFAGRLVFAATPDGVWRLEW